MSGSNLSGNWSRARSFVRISTVVKGGGKVQFDFQKILELAGAAATAAGNAGVPFAGLAGTIATEIDALITRTANASGKTREEIIAQMQIDGAQNLIELAKDAAKGE